MTLEQFIREYYIEMHGNYYSRYTIAERGLAYQDASPLKLRGVKKDYEKFKSSYEEWLKEYKW